MVLLRTFIAAVLLLLLPDIYIYRTYLSGRSRRCRWGYWVPSATLLAGLAAYMAGPDTWRATFGTYLVAVFCIAIPKVLFLLADLPLRLVCRWGLCTARLRLLIALSVATLGLGYLVYGAVRGKEDFRIREVTFTSPALPDAFDGYRLAQLSDLHIGGWKGNEAAVRRAVDLCNGLRPDAIVFTGDLVNSRATELDGFMPLLAGLHAPDGVFSVLGNHDYGTYARWSSVRERQANLDSLKQRERQMGWDLLLNEHRILRRGTDSLVIAGVENSGRPPFPDLGDLPRALQGAENAFCILLSHDPTHWRREVLPQSAVALMLAGHTHDMQISLFGYSASRWFYPEHRGLYLEDGRGLYVNIGLGYALLPLRIGAWPEITLITLKKQQPPRSNNL